MAKVKIGREEAGSGTVRMIPVLGITPQPLFDEVSQNAQRTLGSALPVLDRRNGAIEGPAGCEILMRQK
jgi:hypothetical protein